MPSSGDGTGWDETLPTDSDDQADGPKEFRDLRKGTRIRVEKEHVLPAASSVGGEHKNGSAVAYYQTAFPSNRPDGTTPLNAEDDGRIFVKDTTGAFHYWDGTGWQSMKVVDVDQVLDGLLTKDKVATGFTLGIYPYAIIKDEKADGSNGGTFTPGGWRTRTLQTEHTDVGAIVTLAANQFTLVAGTYRVKARAAGYRCDQHQVRLANITSGATAAYGTPSTSNATDGDMNHSEVETYLDLAVDSVFELQHICGTLKSTSGMGVATSLGGVEVFAVVEIYKLL